ncbi:hypothetical protein DCC85_04575 [Paenibacillus sp. CAA11]|uniref:ankyrin repeat domain-containing protein n=1 Tax=Paenibacillus sp. CAA11 TaxID=1532905 RepID=UPI000D3CF855|nr:ankyrin repeat domain-containing protein [Paenibacillus sp. CAA11]AWB43569.1 hypothetical protein DCC85_04575 [Paenibacillus sp. CAA11]
MKRQTGLAGVLVMLVMLGMLFGGCGKNAALNGHEGENRAADQTSVEVADTTAQAKGAEKPEEQAKPAEQNERGGSSAKVKNSADREACKAYYPQGGGASKADLVIDDEGPTVIIKQKDGTRIEYGVQGAAMNANVEALKMLKRCGADLNQKNDAGQTPLLLAVEGKASATGQEDAKKYDEAVDYLLEQGVRPNEKSNTRRTAYMAAYMNGDSRNEKKLKPFSTSAEQATVRLYSGLEKLSLSQVKQLVEVKHADVNAGFGQLDFPAFFHAVELERTDIAEYMIEHGADLSLCPGEEGGLTILEFAVSMGNLPLTQFLLEHPYGFDVTTPSDDMQIPLLATAVSQSNYEMSKYLIEQGADVNAVYSDQGDELSILQSVNETEPAGKKIKELLIANGAKE